MGLAHRAQGSASMYFSSSRSLLTNSCASLLGRPSSIRSADLTAGGGGASVSPAGPALAAQSPWALQEAGPAPPEAHSPWARGRRRCRMTGWPALALPPTWGLATPLTLPRPRAASPAKSLVDSQSWSMTVNSTQAPRRRQASAGTELQGGGEVGGHLEPCSPLRPAGRGGTLTSRRARRTRGAASGS